MSDEWGGIADEFEGLDEPSEPEDTSDPSEPDTPSDPEGTSEPSEPSDVRLQSPIKEHWNEYPTYLYPQLYEEVQEVYMDLEYQCKKEADFNPEKYRHFQAVAWSVALEELSEMDASEFVEKVDELGLR